VTLIWYASPHPTPIFTISSLSLFPSQVSTTLRTAPRFLTMGLHVGAALALFPAILAGHTAIVTLLVEEGKVGVELRCPGNNITPLMAALTVDNLHIAEYLLLKRADPSSTCIVTEDGRAENDSTFPLKMASQRGNVAMVRLEKGRWFSLLFTHLG
jgi:hypothetical protein